MNTTDAPNVIPAEGRTDLPLGAKETLLQGAEMRDLSRRGLGMIVRRGISYLELLPSVVEFVLSPSRRASRTGGFLSKRVSPDFFGINVAPGPNDKTDDYLVARLKELGVRRVRIDYGYGEDSRIHAGRLIERLGQEGFAVLVHLVPPRSEAGLAGTREADQRWERFVRRAVERFRGTAEGMEVGSAPNRYGWAGFTMRGYARWVTIGAKLCREAGLPWYGPNVTDFSPIYNAGLLGMLRRRGVLPDAHTDNLFVDRAGEPERLDPKVFSRGRRRFHMNLVGKAAFLSAISHHFGIRRTFSTYSYWTLDVKSSRKRRYVTEAAYAAYLVRYLVLAATCGFLDRVYWGQMISFGKGIIDDGTDVEPRTPTVHHQWLLHGEVENYRARLGFSAYANLMKWFRSEARFVRRVPTPPGTFVMEFLREEDKKRFLIAWTRDGIVHDISYLFRDAAVDVERITDTIGHEREASDLMIRSSPHVIECRRTPVVRPSAKTDWGALGELHPRGGEFEWDVIQEGNHHGLVRCGCEDVVRAIVYDEPIPDEYQITKLQGKTSQERALRIFNGVADLLHHGVGCLRVVGVLSDPAGEVLLVSERRPEGLPLDVLLSRLDPRDIGDGQMGTEILRAAALLIESMHEEGFLHGALTADSLGVMPPDQGSGRPAEAFLIPDRLGKLHKTRRAGGLRRRLDRLPLDLESPWREELRVQLKLLEEAE